MDKLDAYDLEKVQSFKRLGATIECITGFEDTLLVAIRGGQILQYKATYVFDTNKNKLKVRLNATTHKSFSKPITQMKAFPTCSMLIANYDNMLHVHDLDTFDLKTSLPTTKGVTLFDVFVKEELGDNKKIQIKSKVKICVAIGRYLKILKWNGETFEDTETDLKVSKPIKGLLWCRDRLFVGVKDEYFILKPKTGEIHEVFSFGSNQKEPIMTRIDNNTAILGQNNKSVFVNSGGKIVKKHSITWSGIPEFIIHDPPYLVAVLDRYVEVKSVDPTISIQRMDIKHVKSITSGSGLIFMETMSSVYMLSIRSWQERVMSLTQQKHFELAIQIVSLNDGPAEQIVKIKAQHGVRLFCKQKYVESMDVFEQLAIDPAHVVGMYPDLLPSKLRNALHYPEKIPTMHAGDVDRAFVNLQDYLKNKRKQIEKRDDMPEFIPIMEHKSNHTLKTKEQALTVIDTTLLKVYIQINEAAIAPLLRTASNKVSFPEAEKVLLQTQKFSELIILYELHEEHAKALSMMKEQASKTKSPLYGTDMTIHYLQKLGVNHMSLVFEHAEWVLDINPYDGLKIFTEDEEAIKALPRGHVLSFIEKVKQDLAISYLEHVIYEWNDGTEGLHFLLVQHLRERVTELYNKFLQTRSGDSNLPKAGEEPGLLGKYRRKLLKFLNETHIYKPDDVLTRFPIDCFFKEQTILLGRLGRHQQALGILVHKLGDLSQAEQYCANYFKMDGEDDRNVYLYLLKICLQPPEAVSPGELEDETESQVSLQTVINLLTDHAAVIDLQQALHILPDDIPVRQLSTYLEAAFQIYISRKHMYKVHRKILYEDSLQVSEQRIEIAKKHVTLEDETICTVCKRRIGKSVFALHTSGKITHYGCSTEYTQSMHIEESDWYSLDDQE